MRDDSNLQSDFVIFFTVRSVFTFDRCQPFSSNEGAERKRKKNWLFDLLCWWIFGKVSGERRAREREILPRKRGESETARRKKRYKCGLVCVLYTLNIYIGLVVDK